MKYFKLTIEYLRKNFFRLFLLVLLPATVLGLFCEPASMPVLLKQIGASGETMTFGEIYGNTTTFYQAWWQIVLIIIVPVFGISAMAGVIDRDVKIGEFTFRKIHIRVNENFWMATTVVIIVIIILELAQLMLAALIGLWLTVLPLSTGLILSWISVALIYFLAMCVFTTGAMWIPHTLNTGYSPLRALFDAIRQTRDHFWALFAGAILSMLPLLVIVFVEGLLALGITQIVVGVCYGLLIIYYASFIFVTYYDIEGLEREDLNKIKIWSRK